MKNTDGALRHALEESHPSALFYKISP